MGAFTGMENAEVGQGGVYIQPGIYSDVEILALKLGKSRKKQEFFAAELRIHESAGDGANPEDSKATWMVMLHHDAALGNIRAFLAAAAGVDVKEVDEKAAELAVSDEQPFAGVHLRAEASNITTKKGLPFTKVLWESKS